MHNLMSSNVYMDEITNLVEHFKHFKSPIPIPTFYWDYIKTQKVYLLSVDCTEFSQTWSKSYPEVNVRSPIPPAICMVGLILNL